MLSATRREKDEFNMTVEGDRAVQKWRELAHLVLRDKKHDFMNTVYRIKEMQEMEKNNISKANELNENYDEKGRIATRISSYIGQKFLKLVLDKQKFKK